MAEKPTNDKAESDSEDPRRERTPSEATTSSSGVDESEFNRWLKRKEEKRSGLVHKVSSRSGGLARRPLNKTSKKQKVRLKSYKDATELHFMLEGNKVCFLCGNRDNLSIHHVSKRGANIAKDLMTLCMSSSYMSNKYPESNQAEGCHQWVEQNHNLARQLGLLK